MYRNDKQVVLTLKNMSVKLSSADRHFGMAVCHTVDTTYDHTPTLI